MPAHRHHRAAFVLAAAAFLTWILFVWPIALRAGQRAEAGERGRIRLELYGGFSFLNPTDMNQFVEYDKSVHEFVYDAYFDYLRNNNTIQSWRKNVEGERKKIKNALPFGIRFRYSLLDFLDISVGFQYMRRGPSESLKFLYTRNESATTQYLESLDFTPYKMDVRAYYPSLGVHFYKGFGRILKAEGFLVGGILFADCSYESRWNYTWTIQGPDYSWEAHKSEGLLSEEGSGIGISLELGGRFGIAVYRKIDLFLEAGYAYQVVKSLSGSGFEIHGEDMETWEGRWGMKSETMTTPWGNRRLLYPTNYETDGTGIEDFRLNLSGFRLRIGVSWAF
jgi:hypothetical protein